MTSQSVVKHTPGPWKMILAPTQVVTNNKVIATINHTLIIDDEVYANADLIASAPELLKACKLLMKYMLSAESSESVAEEGIALAKFAIAKAEGGK